MGLDMYLKAEKYVSGWKHSGAEEIAVYKQVICAMGFESSPCEESPFLDVTMTIGYWRKANAIHAWFVENCQDGKDECEPSWVPEKALKELREICAKLLATKDTELGAEQLPPQAGFFFGSTDIDGYYWADIEKTIPIIDQALALDAAGWEIQYQSSW